MLLLHLTIQLHAVATAEFKHWICYFIILIKIGFYIKYEIMLYHRFIWFLDVLF